MSKIKSAEGYEEALAEEVKQQAIKDSFFEQFPELKEAIISFPVIIQGKAMYGVHKEEIEKHCLSKQRVREALIKIAKKHKLHNEGIYTLYACFIADVKRELGLEK
jgi:hypothetical protein